MEDPECPPCRADGAHQGRWIGCDPGRGLRTDHTRSEEVLIEVAFAGVNFADLLMRLGFYQPRPPYPFTPGYEVSGIIAATGAEVEGLAVGDRVVAAMSNGGQASHVVTSTDRTVRLPDDVSLETAAAMPVTYLTAHHMPHHLGHLRAEDRVLIHGGGGGVGTAALQLCRWAGVTEVWATASAPKADIIRSLGDDPSTDMRRISSRWSVAQRMDRESITSSTPSVVITSHEACPCSVRVGVCTRSGSPPRLHVHDAHPCVPSWHGDGAHAPTPIG